VGKVSQAKRKGNRVGGGEKIKFQKENRDQGGKKLGRGLRENKVAKKN
jgi:hypothetical protein